jgi:APA family basic amino acid/polyamine antiporter
LASAKVFVRDATGLVRTLSFTDQFLMSQGLINVLNGFALTVLFAPFFFPGANIPLVFLVGCIPVFGMSVVYSLLTWAMPRSGGDYVWSTRIMGPLYGSIQMIFLLIGTVYMGAVFGTAMAVSSGIAGMLFGLGVDLNIPVLISLSTQCGPTFIFGYVLSILTLLAIVVVSMLGLRVYARFQIVAMIVFYIAVIAFIGALITFNPSSFPSVFDNAMRLAGRTDVTYSGVVQQAASFSTGFSLSMTLLAAPIWGFQPFTGYNFGTYLAGETRSAKASMTRALFLSTIVATVIMVFESVLVYNAFGTAFINGVSYVYYNVSGLPVLPTTTMMAGLLNPVVAILIGLAIFLADVIITFAFLFSCSRMIFASSFDGMLPAVFNQVNERFRTPIWATALIGIAFGVMMTIYWWAGQIAAVLNISLVAPIAYALPLAAAALFYFRKRELYKRTLGAMKPIILIVSALIALGFFIVYAFALVFPINAGTYLGASLSLAIEVVVVTLAIGVLIYAYGRARARSLGLDFRMAYDEIPPE